MKISKTTELRNSTIAKKYNQGKKTVKPAKPVAIPENETAHTSKIPRKEKKTGGITNKKSSKSATAEDRKKEFARKATYVFEDDSDGEIVITKEQLKAIQRELHKAEAVAPTNVPGKTL